MKRLFCLLLAMCVIFGAVPFVAAQSTGKPIYEMVDGGAVLTRFEGESLAYTVPETVDGVPVVGIGARAFEDSDLVYIALPNTVTFIEEIAFLQCYNLKTVVLPEHLQRLGGAAFLGCIALQKIKIPSGVTKLEGSTFRGCTALTDVELPKGLTTIGQFEFAECTALTKVTLPSTLTTINDYAFYEDTALEEVDFSKTALTSIGASAFGSCHSLKNVQFPKTLERIGENAFYQCKNIQELTLPGRLKEMGNFAFENTGIQSLRIEMGDLTRLPAGAFRGCGQLKQVELPASLGSIMDSAFAYCVSLTNISLPRVMFLREGAFKGCTALKTVNVWLDFMGFSPSAFENCTSLVSVEGCGDQRITVEENCFRNCSSLQRVDGLFSTIGKSAFENCTSLTSVPFSAKISQIGERAFYGCSSLNNVRIPNGVLFMGDEAFGNCASLDTVTFEFLEEESAVGINGKAFLYSKLYNTPENWVNGGLYMDGVLLRVDQEYSGEFVGMEGTHTVARYAFDNCDAITKVTLPEELHQVNLYAFHSCDTLETVKFGWQLRRVHTNAFLDNPNLKTVEFTQNTDRLVVQSEWVRNAHPNFQAVAEPYGSPKKYMEQGNLVFVNAQKITLGNPNGDDDVNAKDALFTLKSAVGKACPVEKQRWAMDMNEDDKVDARDALIMLKIAVGSAKAR